MSTASVTPQSPQSSSSNLLTGINNNNNNGSNSGGSSSSDGTTAAKKPSPSYLKGYPYLFVRETDQVCRLLRTTVICQAALCNNTKETLFQTDYFCTLCEEYLREDELQPHLFGEPHRAETCDNSFVRVTATGGQQSRSKFVYICVVCWAKIVSPEELLNHRKCCRVDPPEEELENGAVPMVNRGGINIRMDLGAKDMSRYDTSRDSGRRPTLSRDNTSGRRRPSPLPTETRTAAAAAPPPTSSCWSTRATQCPVFHRV